MMSARLPCALFLMCLTAEGGCALHRPPVPVPDEAPDPAALFQAGLDALQQAEPSLEQALQLFGRACDVGAGLPRAQYCFNAGWAADQLGLVEAAEQGYTDALTADPRYGPAAHNLAALYMATDRPQRAVEVCEAQLPSTPDNPSLLLQLAAALAQAGDLAGAEERVQQVMKRQPDHARAYDVLAYAYYVNGMYEMSLLVGEMPAAGEPDAGDLNLRGLAWLKLGEEEMAAEQFRRARVLEPDHAQANLNLGFIATRSADYPTAAECFHTVLAHQPHSADARIGLAVAHRGVADFDGALAQYDRVLATQPTHPLALLNKAMVLDLAGRFDESLTVLDRHAAAHGEEATAAAREQVLAHQRAWEDEQRRIREWEEWLERRRAEAREATAALERDLEQAADLKERFGDRADAVHPSFNESLYGYMMQAWEAIELEDDPDLIRLVHEYLRQFITEEYLPAIGEPVETWSRPDAARATTPR